MLDTRGNLLSRTISDDTTSQTTSYTYDGEDRRLSVSGDREFPMTSTYDESGNLVSMTDGNNHRTTYHYDRYDRKTNCVYADGSTESWLYDDADNLV